jgi:cobalt-zinc-cadmium efflux system outer membrane protein
MRSIFTPLGLAVLLAQPAYSYAQAAIAAQQLQAPPGTEPGIAGPPLTLAQALSLAFQHHPGLAVAAQDIAVVAGQRVQAAARPNPELSYLSEGTERDRRTTTLQITQAVELGGKRAARIAAAGRESEVAAADQATLRNDLNADVALRVAAGKISPVDETRARVAEAGSRIELSQARNELAMARRRLAATWANVVPVPDRLIAPEPAPSVPAQPRDPLAASPQLARAQFEVARQKAQVALERSRRMPDLALTLGSRRDEQLGLRQTVFGVALPLPLFDRNGGNVESASRRADKAAEQLKALRNSLSARLDEALLRRAGAQAELAIIQADILPGAQSAFDAASKGAELGKFSFLDVLDAQRSLFQAKNQYIRALAEFYRASADIERLTGAPISAAPGVNQ